MVYFFLWHADYAQQRSRYTFTQVGVASHYGQLLCILNFKNEHLICGELKVNNFSFQSYTYAAGKAVKWPELRSPGCFIEDVVIIVVGKGREN